MRSLRLVATQTRTVWFTDLQGSAAGSRWLGGPVPLTNLPAQVSSFIGRDAELAAVRAQYFPRYAARDWSITVSRATLARIVDPVTGAVRDELPRNPLGKILERELREELR